MTELITIRKSLAEALLQVPLANHQTVTALTALRRQVKRQETSSARLIRSSPLWSSVN